MIINSINSVSLCGQAKSFLCEKKKGEKHSRMISASRAWGTYSMIAPRIAHHVVPTVLPRTIIVGDVHGCFDELRELLDKCLYNKETSTLILVGDLVNKGPYSSEVVKFARENKILCVRGNHDDACLKHALAWRQHVETLSTQTSSCETVDITASSSVSTSAGQSGNTVTSTSTYSLPDHYSYVKSFTDLEIEWLRELPYTISLPSLNSIVVHAGLVPHTPLADQTFVDMYAMRNLVEADAGDEVELGVSEATKTETKTESEGGTGDRNAALQRGKPRFKGTSTDQGIAWGGIWDGFLPRGFLATTDDECDKDDKDKNGDGHNVHVYFGHDAKRGLQRHPNATGLDTGCCYGKKLTAIILPEGEIVSVDAKRVYEVPKGKD